MPACVSSPRLPPLPPTSSRSASPMSANQPTRADDLIARLVQNGDDAAAAIDTDTLTVLDTCRAVAGTDDCGEAVLARDDGGVAHRAADIGHCPGDLVEDRRPGGIGNLANQNVPLFEARHLLHRRDDTGGPLGDAATRRDPSDFILVGS